jgi:hypothetical protein
VVEGYTAQEIADQTGSPRGSILSLIHRAKKKLHGGLLKGYDRKSIGPGTMTEEQIDKLLKQHYASVSLDTGSLERILASTAQGSKSKVIPFYRSTWFSYATAACIALMLVSTVILRVANRSGPFSQTDFASLVVQVHDLHLQPDVYSGDLNSIAIGLDHSEFSIIPTNMDNLGKYQVMGGRQCGHAGLKAVHVVLVDEKTQKESCLYVLPDHESFKQFQNAMVRVGNAHVSVWHDNGRLFALYDPESSGR